MNSKVAHVRRLPGSDPLKEQTLYVPINMGLTDDVYRNQATAFYGELEKLELHKTDGAIVIARDRLLLGARMKILDVDDFDEDKLPYQCGLRHTAAQAGSKLENFLWALVLGEETNDVRIFVDGIETLSHLPGKKQKPTAI